MFRSHCLIFCAILFGIAASADVSSAQTSSLLGMNLSDAQEEMPFLNVLKMAGGWVPETMPGYQDTGEGTELYSTYVDGNHYPLSLTTGSHTFTQVSAYPLLPSAGTSTTAKFSCGYLRVALYRRAKHGDGRYHRRHSC